jgi:hypothetical protein
MSMVQQNADGVIVRNTTLNKVYRDTLANFALDFAVTAPTLPTGATDRIYDAGVRHSITDGHTVIQGGPMPWSVGDSAIANINTGLANQTARQPPPPTAPH